MSKKRKLELSLERKNNTSNTDVAPCIQVGWIGWMDGSLGLVEYRAPYGANKCQV